VREIAFKNELADCFAHAQTLFVASLDGFVQQPRFFPQAELPFSDVSRHALRRRTNQCQFKIVDWSSAVHGDVGQDAPLHQVNQKP
jgi:hypothetical protein